MMIREVEAIRRARRDAWRVSGEHPGQGLFDYMTRTAAEHAADQQVFVGEHDIRTYALGDLYESGLSIASAIADLGIGPGVAVAVHLASTPEAIMSYLAVHALSATLIPIPSIYSAQETGFILADSHAKMLITASQWRGHSYLDPIPRYLANGHLEHVAVVGTCPRQYRPFSELVTVPARRLPAAPDTGRENAAAIIYTSGSTANPKGVLHSSDTLAYEVQQQYTPSRMTDSIWLNAVPAGHMGGYLAALKMMMLGQPGVWLDRWDPATALSLIQQYRVNTATLVPFHLMTLIEAMEQGDTSDLHLRDVLCGSTSVPSALIINAAKHGVLAYRCYGSTEHPSISKSDPRASLTHRAQTDGSVLPGVTVRVVGEDDKDLPDGNEGEIITIGPDQFLRYAGDDSSGSAFTPDGYFRTGDLGRLDNGVLTVTGRKKEIIIRGGENISAREVEDLLRRHPAIRDAAVVARPHDHYGEQAWAFLETVDNVQLTLEDVRQHFRQIGVARQKTPEGVVILKEFPRTPAGKVAKRELQNSIDRARS